MIGSRPQTAGNSLRLDLIGNSPDFLNVARFHVCFPLSRSPKRRRSRSNSRTRMSKHRRSRSRSRDRHHFSPHSRSQERRDREKERERRQKGLPPARSESLSSERRRRTVEPALLCHVVPSHVFFQSAARLCGWGSWTRGRSSKMWPVYWRSSVRSSPST